MQMKQLVIEDVGWYGMAAIFLAYALNTLGILDAHSILYQLMNLTGAIGIVIEASSKRAMPPAVLNALWAAVAFVAILKMAVF